MKVSVVFLPHSQHCLCSHETTKLDQNGKCTPNIGHFVLWLAIQLIIHHSKQLIIPNNLSFNIQNNLSFKTTYHSTFKTTYHSKQLIIQSNSSHQEHVIREWRHIKVIPQRFLVQRETVDVELVMQHPFWLERVPNWRTVIDRMAGVLRRSPTPTSGLTI